MRNAIDLIKTIMIMHDHGEATKRLAKPSNFFQCVLLKPTKNFLSVLPSLRRFHCVSCKSIMILLEPSTILFQLF